jgi:hypothetical protein
VPAQVVSTSDWAELGDRLDDLPVLAAVPALLCSTPSDASS